MVGINVVMRIYGRIRFKKTDSVLEIYRKEVKFPAIF